MAKSSNIQAVFFDAGRTIWNRGGQKDIHEPDPPEFVEYCQQFGLETNQMMMGLCMQATFGNPKALRGQVGGDDFLYDSTYFQNEVFPKADENIVKLIKNNQLLPLIDIMAMAQSSSRLVRPIINLIERLRTPPATYKERVKIGIISDNIDFGFEHPYVMFSRKENDNFESIQHLFDDVVNSCEIDMCKATNAVGMLKLACERINVSPENCIFIDDLPHNIEKAREIGMTGFVIDVTDKTNVDNIVKSVEYLCYGIKESGISETRSKL